MTKSVDRRTFLAGSVAAATCVGQVSASLSPVRETARAGVVDEYYELRRYRLAAEQERDAVSKYVESALFPALRRAELERIGAFTVTAEAPDFSLYVLITYPSIEQFLGLRPKLEADRAYQKAAQEHFACPPTRPAYQRIENRLMSAFRGMPRLELPPPTKSGERMFEIRTYESHNEDAARRKVEMFDTGEIQLMRDVELGPVFFGSTLVGHDVPNLTYMLSAENRQAHDAHWQAFRTHPRWTRMKAIPKYVGTVSKITKTFLLPTAYSYI